MTTGKRAATGKRAEQIKVEEMTKGFEFLMQFTAAEQAQLMSWLEELVTEGQIEIDHTHALTNAFDSLADISVGRPIICCRV